MSNSQEAFLLIALTGLLWAGVGGFYSRVARKGHRVLLFSLIVSLFVSCFSWAACDWDALLAGAVPKAPIFVPIMLMTGIASQAGMILMMHSMRLGRQAAAWTISQSAMVVPFLAGVLIWQERMSAGNLLGVVILLVSIVLFGQRVHEEGKPPAKQTWFVLALLAFAVSGLGATLSTAPSHWHGWQDTARLRVPLLNTAALLAFGTFGVREAMKKMPSKDEWLTAILCALTVFAGQNTFYAGMDRMALVQKVSLTYPLSISLCIMAFAVYTRLHLGEKLGRLGAMGLTLGVIGILLLGI
ncbi:MAG TPA: hypothetical protein PKH07_11650 [bacterium]|nr:hypothetical protein [bacterium]